MNVPQANPMNIKLPESVQQVTETIGNTINDAKTNVANSFSDFSNQATAGVGASSQFLQSNTIVAKFAFLIVVIIGFLFLLNLGVILLGYFLNPSDNPYIVKGLLSGQSSLTFNQDPSTGDVKKIIKISNNQRTGMEFTWSVWLYINDLGSDSKKYQFVFNKGDATFGSNNKTTINNGPGLYISPNTGKSAKIHVIMNTSKSNDDNNFIDVDDIPIRKWVNVMIRLENTMLDIYINGTISGRLNLPLVPKQNYNDINVCQGGGFNGNLSDLRYFNHALSIVEINNIIYWGPNLTSYDDNISKSGGYDYLSSLWYSKKI
jgi:hypothetical protein